MINAVPERTSVESESRESRGFLMRNDERSLRILHRISLRPGPFQVDARRAFLYLKRQKLGAPVAMKNLELGLRSEALEEIERAVDEERLLYGEKTSERMAFLEMRADVQRTVREMKAQGDRELVSAMDELIPDAEKRESPLYREASEVLKNVAEAMGIRRPIVLEITRNPQMNAFVLANEKQGGPMDDASAGPLRVYVNAGLISTLDKVMRQTGSRFTKDHLAGILGHELQHLRQPKHNADVAHGDAKLSQRLEYDADLVAIESADLAGYNPAAMIEVLQAVATMTGGLKEAVGHYFGGTHPMSANRVGDLLDAYNRADRVFYSADVAQQPFDDAIFAEADRWTRERLRKEVSEAQDWTDWDRVVEALEADPNATFADAEMVLEGFRVQLEARAVLSEAAHELRTGELGLRDALLYAANALMSEEKIYFPLWNSLADDAPHASDSWYSTGSGQVPAIGRSTLLRLVTDSPDVSVHEDPGLADSVDRKQIQRLVDSIHADTLLVPRSFENGPFRTIEDLYDEDSDQAREFWIKVARTSGYGATPLADRRQAMALLVSRAFWYPRKIGVTYQNEEVALKLGVLRDLESSKITGPEISSMSPAEWGQALGALTNRIATIRTEAERAVVETERPAGERAPELNRGIDLAPFVGLTFDDSNGTLPGATEATRERLRVQDRLFAVARRLFDRELGQAVAEERLGHSIPDISEAKDWMFRRAVVDYVFAKDRKVVMPIASRQDVARFGAVRDYFRLVPTSVRRQNGYGLPGDLRAYNQRHAKNVDETTTSMVGELVAADQSRKQDAFRSEDIGDRLREIRQLANTPLLSRAIHSQVYNPQSEEIKKLLGTHQGTFQMKRRLFTQWAQESLRSVGNILEAEAPRSETGPLNRAFQNVRGFFNAEIAREVERAEYDRSTASKRKFSLAATRFYAAAFADDAREIGAISPVEIDPFQETT